MEFVILVVHILLALALIGVILIQPPENSAMGGLGGSNPMAAFGGRGQGNILTRATAILASLFIVTSIVLAIISGHKPKQASILDAATNAATPVAEKPAEEPKAPETPAVPLAK